LLSGHSQLPFAFFSWSAHHRALHSFPTRRSSDLRQLRVGTVLEGSVRRAGDRLRVTAQLVNVKDGYHLWAEAYDRDLRDVFAVRSEEHTSELQSLAYLVCRLLLEKKKFDNKASTR